MQIARGRKIAPGQTTDTINCEAKYSSTVFRDTTAIRHYRSGMHHIALTVPYSNHSEKLGIWHCR